MNAKVRLERRLAHAPKPEVPLAHAERSEAHRAALDFERRLALEERQADRHRQRRVPGERPFRRQDGESDLARVSRHGHAARTKTESLRFRRQGAHEAPKLRLSRRPRASSSRIERAAAMAPATPGIIEPVSAEARTTAPGGCRDGSGTAFPSTRPSSTPSASRASSSFGPEPTASVASAAEARRSRLLLRGSRDRSALDRSTPSARARVPKTVAAPSRARQLRPRHVHAAHAELAPGPGRSRRRLPASLARRHARRPERRARRRGRHALRLARRTTRARRRAAPSRATAPRSRA